MKKYVLILLSLYSIGSYATTHDASTDNNNSNLLVQLVDTKLKANQEAMAELNDKVDTKLADKFKQLDDKGTYVSWWLNMLAIWLTALGIFAPIGGYILNRRINENIKNSSDTIKKEVYNLQTEINHKLQEANQVLDELREIHKNASLKANEITELAEKLTEPNISPESTKKALDSAKQIQHKLTTEEWFIMGFGAQQNKQYNDAMVYYNQAVKLSNDDRLTSMIYNNLGTVKAELELHKEAVQDYDKAVELNPQYAEAYNNRGNTKTRLGQYAEAIQDYDETIKLNPKLAEAYNNRGNAKAELGQCTEAIQDYDKAIELNPKYAKAYYNRGNAKAELEQYSEAIQDYDIAIELNPKSAKAYSNRGNAKVALRQYNESIKDYNRAIELNPQYAQAYGNRGLSKHNLQQYTDAIKDYDKVIELDSENVSAYFNKSRVYAIQNDKTQALIWLDKALQLGCPVADIMQYSDWQHYHNDAEFKELINKYDKNNHANQS